MLSDLLLQWRALGPDATPVQVWSVGLPGQGAYAGLYAQGADAPCFADPTYGEGSVFSRYEAEVDDLFVIDQSGMVRYKVHLPAFDLTTSENRDRLDEWVRGLAEP